MSSWIKSVVFVAAVTSLALVVLPVFAQLDKEVNVVGTGLDGTTDLTEALTKTTNAFLGLMGVIATIVIIYAGVKLVISVGDEKAAESAKHTILYAVIGLIIIGLAALIVNFVIGALPGGQGGDGDNLIKAVTTIVNMFLMVVGTIAGVMLIIGGVRYILSQGEDSQTEKAKQTILYAIIGLIVIGIAAIVVNFTIGAIAAGRGGGGGAVNNGGNGQQ